MRPSGRSSCLLLTFYQLFILLINPHHAASLIPSNNSFTNSIFNKTAAITTTSTHSITLVSPPQNTLSTTAIPKPLAQPTALPLKQPKRCRDGCPIGNSSGLICYKNTQCVPLSLLCGSLSNPNATLGVNSTTPINQCLDTTGPATAENPINCQDQLCFPENFLPLPPPGVGQITDLNSNTLCLKGNFFSLYGSLESGGAVRYTRSCVAQTPLPSKAAVCKDWEYSSQGSCFLKTCGPDLHCQLPLKCRTSNITSMNTLYGLCMNPNSTADPSGDILDDSDPLSGHDGLLLGLLVGVCSLLFGVAVGMVICQYRKRRLKQLGLSQTENNEGGQSQKTSLLGKLQIAFDAWCCCSLGEHVRGGALDAGSDNESTSREVRVLSVGEPDGHESGLTSSYRSNLVFSRRWRWGTTPQNSQAALNARVRVGVTPGGVPVLQEVEPPPIYHQGPDLPSYGYRDSIMLMPVSRTLTSAQATPIQIESSEPSKLATLSSPK